MQAEWKTFLQNHGAEFATEDCVDSFGSLQRERSLVLTGTVLADLSHIGLLAVTGKDAEAFLQGQFTNDIVHLDAAHTQLNGYCSPKGRLLASFRVFRSESEILLAMPRSMLEGITKRLQMFVMRSAVSLTDASDRAVHIGLSGENAQTALAELLDNLPAEADGVTQSGECTVLRIAGRALRYEIYGPLAAMQKLWEGLAVRAAPVGAAAWALLDIMAGIPVILTETADAFVPQMVNFATLGGVSFKKGCYPGQEVVARMQYLGKLKRQMYLALVRAETAPQPGDELFSPNNAEQSAGKIVNAQAHPDGAYAVLAVIQIGSRATAPLHLGSVAGPELEFMTLPYTLLDETQSAD